ncbi:MAG: NADH-quinone oxidoreductase subunit N [Anaerolineae bacterium]|nr:NADH-quinone oxidoreductase subunit N [Anaerolineae bacterium]
MQDLILILPLLIVFLGATALLLVDLWVPADRKETVAWTAIFILVDAIIAAVVWLYYNRTGEAVYGFSNMVLTDRYAALLNIVFALIGIGVSLFALRYNRVHQIMRGEFFVLMLFSIGGMMLMAHAANLVTIFVALEMFSIPLYILCGIARPRLDSEESSLKYFLLGAFASGFLVYGIALMYGATGTLDIAAMLKQVERGGSSLLLIVGAGLVLAGLGFKVAAVPFHMWTPDVYDGAPTTVTTFMTTATKAAGFAALMRVFLLGPGAFSVGLVSAIALLAALTMIFGNLFALAQRSVKRMLAYSSIAHAGYLLVGVASVANIGQSANAIIFYLATYAATSLAAFGVLNEVGAMKRDEDHSLERYTGLAKHNPTLAWILAIALFSLMGMPLTAGFAGKYLLFQSAVASGLNWLAILGVLTSVISAFYYLRVIVQMFMKDTPATETIAKDQYCASTPSLVAMGLASLSVIGLGILPTLLLNMFA